eukprot:373502-Pelagomonas_calceolata.AAC.1
MLPLPGAHLLLFRLALAAQAYAAARMAESTLMGLNGEPNIYECSYVQSDVLLGPGGVAKVLPLGNMDAFEQVRLQAVHVSENHRFGTCSSIQVVRSRKCGKGRKAGRTAAEKECQYALHSDMKQGQRKL